MQESEISEMIDEYRTKHGLSCPAGRIAKALHQKHKQALEEQAEVFGKIEQIYAEQISGLKCERKQALIEARIDEIKEVRDDVCEAIDMCYLDMIDERIAKLKKGEV